jgi:hypothetical protein
MLRFLHRFTPGGASLLILTTGVFPTVSKIFLNLRAIPLSADVVVEAKLTIVTSFRTADWRRPEQRLIANGLHGRLFE